MLLGSALGSCQLEPPYPGAAPYLLVTQLEDRELLSRLLEATCRELPEPKPERKGPGNRRHGDRKLPRFAGALFVRRRLFICR